MAVEDHPQYPEWSSAFDRRNEAERHYYEAKMRKRPAGEIKAAKTDLDKAQAEYDKVSSLIE